MIKRRSRFPLLTTHFIFSAKIFLHEQFANVGNPSCISAYHTLTNARAIIDLLHAIIMTEFDLARIGLFPIVCIVSSIIRFSKRNDADYLLLPFVLSLVGSDCWLIHAVQFLHTREYQGLEQRIGQDAPSVLEQGRSGITRGYGDDHREGSSS